MVLLFQGVERLIFMTETGPPKFFIKTFGCQMNMDDSAALARMLRSMGMAEAATAEEASLVHVNSCSVRRKAEEKMLSFLGVLRNRKKTGGSPVIFGVGGCSTELADVRAEILDADYITGAGRPQDYEAIIRNVVSERFPDLAEGAGPFQRGLTSAFQTVVRGCSNFCSYCVVPYARGPESSLSPEQVREEAAIKAEEGAREIILLGQNVLAYGLDLYPKRSLLDAIAAIHDLPGVRRVRFVTSHPKWVTKEFLSGLASLPKACGHFHTPFQSGDDEILRRMKRGYDTAYYIETLEMIRDFSPGCGISADAIVGYPGETEEQFERTLQLVARARVDQLYAFKYSPRPGTSAAERADDVPLEAKKSRLARLLDLQENISREINESLVGEIAETMVFESLGTERRRGRTRENRIVDFTIRDGVKAEPGDELRARITGASPHALKGEAV
jgi:tRNA-2-methylthio-N6-dimethylallyladenosine synthase